MRRVKLLMIARHILAGLWVLLWLMAAPGAHARVLNSDDSAPAFASTDGQGNAHCADRDGVRFQALRASRRIDFSIPSDPLVGDWFFDAGVARQHDVPGMLACAEASPGWASGWQFLLRTALSPRAPSFVS